MIFKKATINDIEKIARIEWESGYKWNKSKDECIKLANKTLNENDSKTYILENNKPVGYFAVSFNKNKKICYLNYFAIKRKYQGKGLSKSLIKKAINVANENKCNEIELWVWGKNFRAIGLYNKFEFYVSDIISDKYQNGDNKLKMKKELT